MDGDEAQNQREDLIALLIEKIENLRPKLLDLSRRNPLISTKLDARSGSTIRVVDELPDVLAFNILQGQRMRFVPLPSLEDDPKDEQSREFRSAVSEARMTDEIYLNAEEAIDPDGEDSLERMKLAERALKDRVREKLGMPPHSTTEDITVVQHAKNNGVSPSYDLPLPHQEHEDGRHTDNDIQTLLLPDDLERKLNGILTKCRTWVQETGINVLHGAFGFLEWKEQNGSAICFAPLVLMPVGVEKKRTRDGAEFWVSGLGEDAETNLVLAEKLKIDFGIELPEFDGGSIEEYLQSVAEHSPPNLEFRVRRQVMFGVFPSARMAMYHDLDATSEAFQNNDIVKALMIGSDDSGDSPFADEYLVDEPEIEKKVPNLVLDSDSSQFSALVDVADGKNIALEGPPGTGKSQTIVNAIASALAEGKKVLFVAEKMAALEVVKSRLESVGLGEFILPLQAERSSREQVIDSLRRRAEVAIPEGDPDYGMKIERFKKHREEIAEYIHVLSSQFGCSGLNVFQALGKGISTQGALKSLPRDIQKLHIEDVENFTASDFQTIQEVAERLATAWEKARGAQPYWRNHSMERLDTFAIGELFDEVDDVIAATADTASKQETLMSFGMEFSGVEEHAAVLRQTLEALIQYANEPEVNLINRLADEASLRTIEEFLTACAKYQETLAEVSAFLPDPNNPDWCSKLSRLADLCVEGNFRDVSLLQLNEVIDSDFTSTQEKAAVVEELRPFMEAVPNCKSISIKNLKDAKAIFDSVSKDVLAIRSDTLAQHEAAITVRTAKEYGDGLRIARDGLKNFVSVKGEISSDELRRIASIIGDSSSFSFFSSKYRNAKRAANELSIRPSFSKDQIVADLRELADWKDEYEKFLAIPKLQNIFGAHFRGLDTDFNLFADLIGFYEAIEERFPRIENIGVRSFIKSADIETLAAIPNIDLDGWDGNFEQLEREVIASKQTDKSRRELAEEISDIHSEILSPLDGGLEQTKELLTKCQYVQQEGVRLSRQSDVARVLADHFEGGHTKSAELDGAISSAKALLDCPHHYHSTLTALISSGELADCLEVLRSFTSSAEASQKKLSHLKAKTGLPDDHFPKETFGRLTEFLRSLKGDKDGLLIFAELAAAKTAYIDSGLPELIDILEAYEVENCDLVKVTEALVARSLCKCVYQQFGDVLAKFNGERLDDLRGRLARADKELIRLSRAQLRRKIYRSSMPPSGNRIGRKSTWTEWALIENEINKKKRFVPIRDLTERAGKALQELKPCWMMSPLAVAQYLKKGGVRFDLCIIDEASQMPPEDAIGALVRCDKALVVGDTNQLPPTSFFRRMIDDEEADEDDSVLDESILQMANAAFRPKRRLRWHYRSRHSGLIKFSNRLIYDDDLIVFPSANEDRKEMGVSYVKVEGSYKAGVNGPEARAIIDAVLQFMFEYPSRSLGVVTLNQKQRDLIIEELEFALRKSPWATKYIDTWRERNDGLESFFVKNLENVQGDERDVIFIGTVYGSSEPGGPVMQRFGPINGLAGQRRLNVLFSRAKEQIVTFSSMTAADIRADEHGNPGTFMLKRWLEYSATGVLEGGSETQKDPDSDFEQYVIEQIREMGCIAVPQVGVAGYFIDIGIKHPDWPHGFILGVECDGASYHSSKSARDRDRLRQEVLENLGWKFHRIWSTDWFNDPFKEAERLRERIMSRLDELKESANDFVQPASESHVGEEYVSPEDDIEDENEDFKESEFVTSQNPDGITVGDRIRVKYLSGAEQVVEFTLSQNVNDPDNGIVSVHEPLGEALLDAEEGEEVEFLVGSYVRRVVVEKIERGEVETPSTPPPATPLAQERGYPEVVSAPSSGLHDESDLFAVAQGTTKVDLKISPDRFYDDDYLFTIRRLGVEIIDKVGPITFRHLSSKIARLHGFQRTGSQIRKRVWAAVNPERKPQKGPSGENIFWPKDVEPKQAMSFRGLSFDDEERSWQQVPYPEKLGLALEIVRRQQAGDNVEMMARRIGLARLTSGTRQELTLLLEAATNF